MNKFIVGLVIGGAIAYMGHRATMFAVDVVNKTTTK